eukprot:57327-Pyramimonas_sp.AAC.1
MKSRPPPRLNLKAAPTTSRPSKPGACSTHVNCPIWWSLTRRAAWKTGPPAKLTTMVARSSKLLPCTLGRTKSRHQHQE